MAASEEQGRLLGCRSVYMLVISERTELIEWYSRHGYRETGERRPFLINDIRFGLPKNRWNSSYWRRYCRRTYHGVKHPGEVSLNFDIRINPAYEVLSAHCLSCHFRSRLCTGIRSAGGFSHQRLSPERRDQLREKLPPNSVVVFSPILPQPGE